jgi:hypothetical protein
MEEEKYLVHSVDEYDGFKVGDIVAVAEDHSSNTENKFTRKGFIGPILSIGVLGDGIYTSYCIKDDSVPHIGYFNCRRVRSLRYSERSLINKK